MENVQKKTYAIVAIAVIIIITIALAFFLLYGPQEEKEEKQEIEEDDRISPLTNQSVVLRMHRIRRKGIIDHMYESGLPFYENFLDFKYEKVISHRDRLRKSFKSVFEGLRPGFGWDNRPSFSYALRFDDYEWESPDTFTTWDTGYINQLVIRNVKEETEEIEVEITLIEKNPAKRFIFGSTPKTARASFSMTYDFRTGRWTGDDYFNDSDGYGHFNNSDFEAWFTIQQVDYDGDGIPYWTEVNILGTNPKIDDRRLDPDHDNCSTAWEWKWGYDPFTWDNHTFLDPDEDGVQNTEEYLISEWLSNPFYPDMYIECDWMEQTPKKIKLLNPDWSSPDGWTHELYEETKWMLIERFNQHGISVHIDDGCMGGGGDLIPFDKAGDDYPMAEYGQEVGVAAGIYDEFFTKERKGIFRYVAICYKGGWAHPQDDRNSYDCIFVPHGALFYKNNAALSWMPRTKRIAQAVSILHELGHTFGFTDEIYDYYHSAFSRQRFTLREPRDDMKVEDFPGMDYVSCMFYEYYFYSVFDFSDGTHGPNDTNDWELLDLAYFQKSSPVVEGLM